jgi:hypothetical protein
MTADDLLFWQVKSGRYREAQVITKSVSGPDPGIEGEGDKYSDPWDLSLVSKAIQDESLIRLGLEIKAQEAHDAEEAAKQAAHDVKLFAPRSRGFMRRAELVKRKALQEDELREAQDQQVQVQDEELDPDDQAVIALLLASNALFEDDDSDSDDDDDE